MGRNLEGSAEKEDISHEEEASTNGRQGLEGPNRHLQMPCMRRSEEDALLVSLLH